MLVAVNDNQPLPSQFVQFRCSFRGYTASKGNALAIASTRNRTTGSEIIVYALPLNVPYQSEVEVKGEEGEFPNVRELEKSA